MGKVVQLLNMGSGLAGSESGTVQSGYSIVLDRGHRLSVDIADGDAVLIEHRLNRAPRFYQAKDERCIKLTMINGFIKFMPKAISNDCLTYEFAYSPFSRLAR